MEQKEQSAPSTQEGKHQYPLANEISSNQQRINESAHREADKDIAKDADLSIHNAKDDLDEGESARLGEDVPI